MSEEQDTGQKRTWRDALGDARRKNTPQHRRLLLVVAVAVLAVVLLGVIPGYIATQPKFMQRYTHFSAQYVTWSTSVHAKVPCQRRHVAPTWTAQTA